MFSLNRSHIHNQYENELTNKGEKRKAGTRWVKECFNEDIWINWYHDNVIHRTDGPASMLYYKNEIITEKWYSGGKLSRIDGGAADKHYYNKNIFIETWYLSGKQGRLEKDKPTKIIYGNNGEIDLISFWTAY
jgi:hypothetical protein